MAVPTYDVRVDWDRNGYGSSGIDVITTDVLKMVRNDDVPGGAPGTLSLIVKNHDGKYSDLVGSSPLAGKLRPRRPIHVAVTPPSIAATGFFDGYVDDIVPLDDPNDPIAEILCSERIGSLLPRLDVDVNRIDRTYREAYEAVLDAAGVTSRTFTATNILQSELPFGFSGKAWDGLVALDLATGSRHATVPLAPFSGTMYELRIVDRLAALEGAATASLTRGTDFERITEWSGIARAVINRQSVRSIGISYAATETEAWVYPGSMPFTIGAGETVEVWAETGPVSSGSVEHAGSGTYSASVAFFTRTAKITITATTATEITSLRIVGRVGIESSVTATKNDTASQAIYDVAAGETIESDMIPSGALAKGLADWYVYRYATPPRTARILQENRPAAFSRVPFDVLSITDSTLGLSGWRCEVVGRQMTVDVMGEKWTQVLTVQELPAQRDFFTVGTDAIGGAAILGY